MKTKTNLNTLGACPRIENLLQKSWICAISRFFSSNRTIILLKKAKNRPKPSFPSSRSLFSNKLLFALCLMLFTSVNYAAESFYEIRADGLACPYCAYGIEKKFMKIDGVKHVDINLEQGKVAVTGIEKLDLQDQQLKTLFNDSGFTFRKIVKKEIRE